MSTQPAVPRQRFTDLNHVVLSLSLGSFHSEILGWGFLGQRWWRNYLHTHSFFEICYAFAGQGLFRINEQDYQVRQGQVFVARPGEVHEIISSQDQPLGIYFWSHTLTQRRDSPPAPTALDELLQAFLTAPCCVSERVPAMQRTLELLTEEVMRKEPGYLQALEGLAVKLLLDTARAVVELPSQPARAETSSRSPAEALVQVIIRYLRDNYHRPLTIRDLAAQVHLSERHTSRLFHSIMGVSILEYLTTLRLEIAAQLLLERQMPIKEIAQATGYPDVRYFTTLFHQHTGLTPAAFRLRGGTSFVARSS